MKTAPWVKLLCREEQLPDSYAALVLDYVAPLAERIYRLHNALSRPVVIGISGAQGSGKSTLALFLANWLGREMRLATAGFSLDDLYLSRAARSSLAHTCHPLFGTRGVPGTHDVGLGRRLLETLTDPESEQDVALPVFDKARDDLLPISMWPRIAAPVDVVLFEGWCVGVRPQAADQLDEPVNALEAEEDADCVWRRAVNDHLRDDYRDLFGLLDALVMLRIPTYDKVGEWRILQEQKLRRKVARPAGPGASACGQSDEQLARFVMHFERLTRHMLETMPGYADSVIDIDAGHRMIGITHRGWGAVSGP
jgi:D-glycerate 3-kinase